MAHRRVDIKEAETKKQELKDFLFWWLLLLYTYRQYVFYPLNGWSLDQSLLLFYALGILLPPIGFMILKKKFGNSVSILFSAVPPFYLYSLLSYLPVFPSFFLRSALIVSVHCLAVVCFFLACWKKRPARDRYVKRQRKKRLAEILSLILIAAMAGSMMALWQPVIYGTDWWFSRKVSAGKNKDDTLFNNREILLCLSDGSWDQLNVEGKRDVLQAAANVERRVLGLSNELNVSVTVMPENQLGCYRDMEKTIYISLSHIQTGDSAEVLDTLCHEAYHSYEYEQIRACLVIEENYPDLKMCRRTRDYQTELKKEVSLFENPDFYEYSSEALETDARGYAAKAVSDYFSKLQSDRIPS